MSHKDSHPTKISLSENAVYQFYKDKIKAKQKPYYIVANDTINKHSIDLDSIYIYSQLPIPPWHQIKPKVNAELTNIITKKDNPHLIKSEGNILIDTKYSNFVKIYKDGSKDPDNNISACGFVIPELKVHKGFRLQQHASIFMCELTAIFLALCWLEVSAR